jgi:hypothetical protein
VGHPGLYVGADCPADCLDTEGIIKCKVLPPRKLQCSCIRAILGLCSLCVVNECGNEFPLVYLVCNMDRQQR